MIRKEPLIRSKMKLSLLALALFVAAASAGITIKDFEKEFHELWNDSDEEAEAAKELEKEEESIEKENEAFAKGEATFKEELNELSGLPKEQFEKEKEGAIPEPKSATKFATGAIEVPDEFRIITDEERAYLESIYEEANRQGVPASYDAKAEGLVTTPKNQLSCGSCAAFAATTVHETCLAKAGTPMQGLDLSEQQLVDCGYNGNSMNGCNGAWVTAYSSYLAQSGGSVSHEAQYPYADRSPALKCLGNPKWNAGAVVSKAVIEYNCDEEKLKALVYKYGAVATGIYASDSSLGNYRSGVYNGCTKDAQIDHAVTVVGYGTENGLDYWLVKNSWGDNWGAGGYIKIHRGSRQCSIAGTCVATECTSTGTAAPAPVAPPPPPVPVELVCDISNLYGPGVTGNYQLTTTINGKDFVSEVKCQDSKCTPAMAGPSNGCMYICGKLTC